MRVRGAPCVAKLIVHRTASGKHAPGGVQAKTAFETEREVYRSLGPSWPVTLVDALKARSGQTSGYVVVTTEFENRPWESYVPSRSNDAAVARELVRQIAQIHRAGVVHWDMFPKKRPVFRPPCSVAASLSTALQKGPRLFGPPRKKTPELALW